MFVFRNCARCSRPRDDSGISLIRHACLHLCRLCANSAWRRRYHTVHGKTEVPTADRTTPECASPILAPLPLCLRAPSFCIFPAALPSRTTHYTDADGQSFDGMHSAIVKCQRSTARVRFHHTGRVIIQEGSGHGVRDERREEGLRPQAGLAGASEPPLTRSRTGSHLRVTSWCRREQTRAVL